MYIVEGYPEFEQDVKEIWNRFISRNNFEVVKINIHSLELRNEKCIIRLNLNAGQRISYFFLNPKTLQNVHYITLAIYFGIYPLKKGNLLGAIDYPLTMDEWTDLYIEEDYRAICKVDLPILLDEIEGNFQFVIDGDFSWEQNIDTWQEWYDANHKPGVPYQYKELSYEHYLKEKQ